MNQTYIDTVRLLLDILPNVFSSGRFAIKGGTALNLFVQDMPRLSVDIDVAFIDHVPNREAALDTIGQELGSIKNALQAREWVIEIAWRALSLRGRASSVESWNILGVTCAGDQS